jgi:hypothetical protein
MGVSTVRVSVFALAWRLNIIVNLFDGKGFGSFSILPSFGRGGGKIGSRAIFKALSSIDGMILPSRELDSSRHGLVFTSINQGLNPSSIRKSSPNTSNVC